MTEPAHLMRWAGSKRRFTARLLDEMPSRIESYCAPFGGSLSDVFALIAAGRLDDGARVIVSDVPIVRDLYTCAYRDPNSLIDALRDYLTALPDYCADDGYEYAKEIVNDETSPPPGRAAALLVLNQLAFNGLWRVNRSGKYNTPRDPSKELDVMAIVDRVTATARALQRVNLYVADGWQHALLADAQVYYADPPYVDTYNAYSATPFSDADQRTLAQTLEHIRKDRGSTVIASNSDARLVHELYSPLKWRHGYIERANNITCDGSTRGSKKLELLMVAR